MHIFATREISAFPTPLKTASQATVPLVAHFASAP